MDNFDIAKFLGKGQNVHGECTGAQPFRDRASHVQLPSTVLPVPFSGIRACETKRMIKMLRKLKKLRERVGGGGGGGREGKEETQRTNPCKPSVPAHR